MSIAPISSQTSDRTDTILPSGWLSLPDAGVLLLSDSDRADFLQRMTTNNISVLRPGEAAVTVLTSPTARIVQVFTVLCREQDLLLLPASGESAALARHLRGQIFFLDKVKVQDLSEQWRRLRVVGAQAAEALRAAGIETPQADDRWIESDGVLAVTQQKYGVPGVELVVPADRVDEIAARLGSNGLVALESEAVEEERIALGRPAPGHELAGDYTPLEVDMEWACSENKGCYTGQEIIARQRTYDKVTRTLVGIRAAAPLAVGESLLSDGREMGKITSAAANAPIALAVVKRPANAPGSRLLAGTQEAEVVALPFTAHNR